MGEGHPGLGWAVGALAGAGGVQVDVGHPAVEVLVVLAPDGLHRIVGGRDGLQHQRHGGTVDLSCGRGGVGQNTQALLLVVKVLRFHRGAPGSVPGRSANC
jgi:hypothetical protein